MVLVSTAISRPRSSLSTIRGLGVGKWVHTIGGALMLTDVRDADRLAVVERRPRNTAGVPSARDHDAGDVDF